MPLRPIRTNQTGHAPFVQPFLHALDRMQARETLQPEQLRARAEALLAERFGPSDAPASTSFVHGPAELVARHALYFDGFGFFLPLPQGTAVAVRAGEPGETLVALEGASEHTPDGAAAPAVCIVQEVLGGGLEAAVVGTIPSCAVEAGLASLAAAAQRACAAYRGERSEGAGVAAPVVRRLHDTAATCTPEAAFGPGTLLAALGAGRAAFALTDARELEVLPVDPPGEGTLGWGLVDTGAPVAPGRDVGALAARALELLRSHGLPAASFSALEHRDLQRALDRLPGELQPAVRYLVKENQRVARLVAAVRRGDWQMFGALLLMSHATERVDGEGTTPEADLVVEVVEEMSIEGMYGARASGRGGAVLVAGQPFVVPACLDRIKARFEERFGRVPATVLL